MVVEAVAVELGHDLKHPLPVVARRDLSDTLLELLVRRPEFVVHHSTSVSRWSSTASSTRSGWHGIQVRKISRSISRSQWISPHRPQRPKPKRALTCSFAWWAVDGFEPPTPAL
jgi:hypothetical protein